MTSGSGSTSLPSSEGPFERLSSFSTSLLTACALLEKGMNRSVLERSLRAFCDDSALQHLLSETQET